MRGAKVNWPGYYDKAMFDSYLCEDCTWEQLAELYGPLSVRWLWQAIHFLWRLAPE